MKKEDDHSGSEEDHRHTEVQRFNAALTDLVYVYC